MRFDLTATFENAEDESVMKEGNIILTSKILAMRALNNAVSNALPPDRGGCSQEKRRERGKLARRIKKMNGSISLSPEELVELRTCSAEAGLVPHLHDQFCDVIDGCQGEKEETKE